MVLVAKRYQNLRQVGEVFQKSDGENYIVVTDGTTAKAVKVYTIEQYSFLLGRAYQQELIEEEKEK